MSEESNINVSEVELEERIRKPATGDSFDTVVKLLGGPSFKEETASGKRRAFWRFYVTDRPPSRNKYEIYQGEFREDQLVFGSILLRGSTG